MSAPTGIVKARGQELDLSSRSWLMGVVNVTPDSFSDERGMKSVDNRVALASKLLSEGADIIDIGGESGVTNAPAVEAEAEAEGSFR